MVRRVIGFLVVLVLTLSGELDAQEAVKPVAAAAEKIRAELKADVGRLLTSNKEVDQAWGAYYAGKYGFTDLAPLLWSLVEPDNDDFRDPQQRCVKSALIDLGATADAKNFKLLLKKRWNLCALNAAIRGKSSEQLLTLMRTVKHTSYQIATCNKLVDMRDTKLSKELLSRVSIELEVNVWDKNRYGMGRRRAASYGDGTISVPKGFPPIVNHSLVRSHPRTGDVLLAGGPTNVYLRRREVAGTSMGVGSSSSDFDMVQYRLASLYQLTGWHMQLHKTALKSKMSMNVKWTTADTFEAEVVARADYLKKEWRELKAALVKDKLLTAEDSATLPISISLSITDHRDEKTPALPATKDLEAKIQGQNRE